MAIGKMRYSVFCSAKLQWNGKKLEPFARVRASGHAESLCHRLMRENPGHVVAAFGPGYKYVNYPLPQGDEGDSHTVSEYGPDGHRNTVGVGR